LVSEVRSALSKRLPAESERRIARNAREVLLEIARSRGAALDEQRVSIDERLATLAKNQLTDEVGDALIAAIADTLRSPTEEQATTMTRWTQAYLTFAVMGLDPTLNAFQASRFNKKTFILDTDVVLEAIVGDGVRSPGLRRLIASLLRMGARVLIPETVLVECVEHAQRSHTTYNYFGHALLQLTPAVVEERVWNVFVKGYYFARLSNPKGRSPGSAGVAVEL
jgi:predicted nucleic acid-binding protein